MSSVTSLGQLSTPLLWAHWGRKLLISQLRSCGCPVCVKAWLWGLRNERKTVRGLPWWLTGKESFYQLQEMRSVPGPGRSHVLQSS